MIQNCVLQFNRTENTVYYDMGIGLFIEQLTLINNNHPLEYYNDPTIYLQIKNEFLNKNKKVSRVFSIILLFFILIYPLLLQTF